MKQPKRVIFATRVLTHYRLSFHEAVRQRLAADGVTYDLIFGVGRPEEEAKGDTVSLPWATRRRVSYFGPGNRLCWQHGFRELGKHDLLIIGHENTLLVNYPLIIRSWFGGARIAFFGHGRGFQARSRKSFAERFKRFWASKVHWWFAYTQSGRDAVIEAGLPADRITVFNNSVDTSAIAQSIQRVDQAAIERLRQDLLQGSPNVAVYVGGIYERKRIPFLLAAAHEIRKLVPDFHLMVIGAGVQAQLVKDAAASHDWIHYMGPRFGDEKTELVHLAKAFLMPGLVGLAVLDAFAYGTPMVTTDLPYHSPEIDYLEDGVNGVMVRDSDNPAAYAKAVARVLNDDAYRAQLQAGGQTAMATYTIEKMAERFAAGVVKALGEQRN